VAELTGRRLTLRPLTPDDAPALLDLRRRNRDFLEPWEPERDDSFFTLAAQKEDIARGIDADDTGGAATFGIFLGSALIGRVSLSQIFHGPFRSCVAGYFLDEAENGRGYATEALELVVDHAFGELGLHRVQAGVMPRNTGSVRVLEKVGFRGEGLAPRYLCINGVWEDHLLYAITAEERGDDG